MKDPSPQVKESLNNENHSYEQMEEAWVSLSTPFISGNEDYNLSSVDNREVESSPVFTCKSSFSSFLVEDSTPCSITTGGFSFSSCCESNVPDFSSPIPSLPSFTFFTPSSAVEQGNDSLGFKAKLSTLDRGIYDSCYLVDLSCVS